MTDDPRAAFVTSGRTQPTMTTPPEALTRDTVRVALVDLLTVGQHHHAASHATLNAVGDTRRARTDRIAHDGQRLKALNQTLNAVAAAFAARQTPRSHTTELRDGLTELAALALGWLDTIPNPRQPNPDTTPAL